MMIIITIEIKYYCINKYIGRLYYFVLKIIALIVVIIMNSKMKNKNNSDSNNDN